MQYPTGKQPFNSALQMKRKQEELMSGRYMNSTLSLILRVSYSNTLQPKGADNNNNNNNNKKHHTSSLLFYYCSHFISIHVAVTYQVTVSDVGFLPL